MPWSSKPRRLHWIIGALTACLWTAASLAQPVETRPVRAPAPGTTTTIGAGTLRGAQIVDYLVPLRAGQRVVFQFRPSNASAYMNVTAPGAVAAMHIGSQAGNRFETAIPSSGNYAVRVYLMRNAARRNEVAKYTLSVMVSAAGAATPGPDYADGVSGGPDFWRVTGAPDRRLGLFKEPSLRAPLVTNLAEGIVARSQGCRMVRGEKWCQLETLDRRYRGWALGRHLREGAPPTLPIPRPTPAPPKVMVGGNGEGEVIYESNNCVVYYDPRGARRRSNSNCFQEQIRWADEAMARYRRERNLR